MHNHERLDQSIEEAGRTIGKTPREIEQAKESAHRAVDSGEVPEEVIEGTMEMVKDLGQATRGDAPEGFSDGNDGGRR